MTTLHPTARLEYLAADATATAQLAGRRATFRETLLRRARYLDPDDRQLLSLVYELNLPIRHIARMRRVSHGVLCRRITSLRKRLTMPLVVALMDETGFLDDFDRDLALAHWVRRQTLQQLADEHRLPRTDVRRRLQFVRGWFDGRKEGLRLAQRLHHLQNV